MKEHTILAPVFFALASVVANRTVVRAIPGGPFISITGDLLPAFLTMLAIFAGIVAVTRKTPLATSRLCFCGGWADRYIKSGNERRRFLGLAIGKRSTHCVVGKSLDKGMSPRSNRKFSHQIRDFTTRRLGAQDFSAQTFVERDCRRRTPVIRSLYRPEFGRCVSLLRTRPPSACYAPGGTSASIPTVHLWMILYRPAWLASTIQVAWPLAQTAICM